MNSQEVINFMDFMDLDEDIIDSRLKNIMERSTFTSQHLTSSIYLLQYKIMINSKEDLDCDNEQECNYIAKLVNRINEENIDKVCKIIQLVLSLNKAKVVSQCEHLIQQILENLIMDLKHLQECTNEDYETANLFLKLKLCDSILDAVINCGDKLSLPLLETPLEEILSSTNEKLKIHFLNITIPKLFHNVIGYNILDRIWQYLIGLRYKCIDNVLKVLSCLSTFYVPVPDNKKSIKFLSDVVYKSEFWLILLDGLMSIDFTTRKMAIYLLKRAIDSISNTKKDFCINSGDNIIFIWHHKDSNKLAENWSNYFILIDSVEEKQSNIVLPSLQIFETIKGIPSSWLNCVFNIGLRHDNTQVRLKCIEYRLMTKISSQGDALVLLEALNDINLYDNLYDSNRLKGKVASTLQDHDSFVCILHSIPTVKWCPVPFYHISDILMNYPHTNLCMDHAQFYDIVCDMLKVSCNSKTIRNAVKFNITYFAGLHGAGLKWNELLNVFKLVKWEKYSDTVKNNHPFIGKIRSLNLKNEEKIYFLDFLTASYKDIEFLLLYLETHQEDVQSFINILYAKIKNIKDIVTRQYSDKMDCFNDAVYVINLCNKTTDRDGFRNLFPAEFHKEFKMIVCQYTQILLSDDHIELNIGETNVYFKGFESIDISNTAIKEVLLHMYKSAILLLKDNSTTLEIKLNCIFIVKILTCKLEANNHEIVSIKDILQLIRNVRFSESQRMDDIGRYKNVFYENSCEIIYGYVKYFTVENIKVIDYNLKEMVNFVEDIIDCGGYGCIKWILVLINELLPLILEKEIETFDIANFICKMWNEIEELKSNNQYVQCIKEFVKLITHNSLLNKGMYNNIIILYCSKIIEYATLKKLPLYYLIHEMDYKDIGKDFGQIIYVLCDILLFSPVPKKDQRITDNVAINIFKDSAYGLNPTESDSNFNYEIQYAAILTLSKIKCPGIIEEIASIIVKKIDDHFRTKQRYHGNSQSHRMLLIGLQHLLFMSLLNLKILKSKIIMKWVMDLLGRLPHQPSVRICLEWFIALHLLIEKSSLNNDVLEMMQSKNIPLVSQFIILYWTLNHKISNKSFKQEEFEFVIDSLLSHTMGQMFNVRLHAQYLATQLWQKVEKCDKYSYMIKIIKKTFSESAKDKNFIKLETDFFIKEFNMIEHLVPSFIYHFLPRYCDIGSNELIHEEYIMNITSKVNNIINTKDAECDFKKEWMEISEHDNRVVKFNLNQMCQISKFADNTENARTVQKKYIPWKNMSDIDVYEIGKKQKKTSQLIVVASLIDKLPNLGGMARTSEVFGVKTYVVDSLRHLQDKQFQSLSVSAERWINVEEVRPGQPLKEYLMTKKSEGYSIVAAEQTSSSIPLQTFKFPNQTLLLLGHEKVGVPCDLLPIMDHCIEIPQQGFVRSLNVHVTAAIFIWEYCRQHVL